MLRLSPKPPLLLLALLLAALPVPLLARDVPFVPTPEQVVDTMLRLAGVGPGDVVVDLGSGDGRIAVSAARDFGARARGVDIDPRRIAEARANARAAGVEDAARFTEGNLFDAPIADASVVTMYLLPEVNLALRPRLLGELRPGTRVVSHDFDMGDWKPDRTMTVPDEGSQVYLWVVPAHVAGTWRLDAGDGGGPWTLDIDQSFQEIRATARRDGQEVRLHDAHVLGERISFAWPDGRRFQGSVDPSARAMNGAPGGSPAATAEAWHATKTRS